MKWYEDKEYQLMAELAEEIQEITRWNRPALLKRLERPLADICVDEQGRFFSGGWSPSYLPSQEDLQEMVSSDLRIKLFDSNPALISLKLFYDRISQNKYFWQFKTYNKLWFAFVMHELYQKEWNPEKKEWEREE